MDLFHCFKFLTSQQVKIVTSAVPAAPPYRTDAAAARDRDTRHRRAAAGGRRDGPGDRFTGILESKSKSLGLLCNVTKQKDNVMQIMFEMCSA